MVKSLLPILLLITIAASTNAEERKSVAAVSGIDSITKIHICNLLLSHGIEPIMEGSVMYGVEVPSARAAEASKLIRKDALWRRYYVFFAKNDVVEPGKAKEKLSRTAFATALKDPIYAPTSALGRFLRCDQIQKLAAKYPYIASMKAYERHYLATPTLLHMGYEIEVDLRDTLEKDLHGYSGSYQVYENGTVINSLGSSKWTQWPDGTK
jgi:hypothetical protein